MSRIAAVFAAALAFAPVTGLAAQTPPSAATAAPPLSAETLAAAVRAAREAERVPAMAALVRRSGVDLIAVDGVRDARSGVPAQTDDLWHIGSCGKAMTAMLLARQVEAGLVRFDSTLAEVFPELAPQMAGRWGEVTVRQLLNHTSGLDDSEDLTAYSLGRQPPYALAERRLELLRRATSVPANRAPGAEHAYSNMGYVLAAAVAERVGGAPYEELLRREVWAPLNLTSAGFGMPALRAPAPTGHVLTDAGELVPLDPRLEQALLPTEVTPAGDIHMSLQDWARFAETAMRGALGQDAPGFLRAETFAELYRLPEGETSGYALGWGVRRTEEGAVQILTHEGSDDYWIADVLILPQEDVIILTAANRYADGSVGRLRRELLRQARAAR